MFPNGTVVEVIADNHFGWEAQYRAFHKGEKRLYKVIKYIPRTEYRWGAEEARYTCLMVNEKGVRRGSWHYRIYESELRPVRSKPVDLEEWL